METVTAVEGRILKGVQLLAACSFITVRSVAFYIVPMSFGRNDPRRAGHQNLPVWPALTKSLT